MAFSPTERIKRSQEVPDMPTAAALELGPEGWKTYDPRRTSPAPESLVSPEERERLQSVLRTAAMVLQRAFGAARVIPLRLSHATKWFNA
jgi:hypothetical protein